MLCLPLTFQGKKKTLKIACGLWRSLYRVCLLGKQKKKKKQKKPSFLLFLYLEFSINQQFSVGALKYSVLLFALFINRVFFLFVLFVYQKLLR